MGNIGFQDNNISVNNLSVGGELDLNFIEGSIPFIDVSGNLVEDNANLFWDGARMGIGTTSPESYVQLDIKAAATNGGIKFHKETTTITGDQIGLRFGFKRDVLATWNTAAAIVAIAEDALTPLTGFAFYAGSAVFGVFERFHIGGAGGVKVGAGVPDASALLEIESTDRGFLPPRMTEAQRDLISSPADGLVIYQTDEITGWYGYETASGWIRLSIDNSKTKFTTTGGKAILLMNKTGSASVKGELVTHHATIDDAVDLTGADSYDCFGAFLDDGVADGSEAWIATSGIVEVMLKDSTVAVADAFASTSDTAGRADLTLTAPVGGFPAATATHFREIGHGIQAVSPGGTGVLARIVMHFN